MRLARRLNSENARGRRPGGKRGTRRVGTGDQEPAEDSPLEGSFFQAFDAIVRQFHRADERLAFAQAMAIGPARDQQIMRSRDAEIMVADCGRVFGVKAFDSVQTCFDQRRDGIIDSVETGMGHDGKAARVVDQRNRVKRGYFIFGHPRGPMLFEKAFKCFVETSAETLLDQGPRHVWASR